MLRLTVGWKRRPPLYGPMALLNWMRKPRLTWTSPLSSSQGTRNMICRSGSTMRSRMLPLVFLVPLDDRFEGFEHFGDGLQKLRLAGVALS